MARRALFASSCACFSSQSFETTTQALVEVARKHGCTSICGLDFGGDVALPDKATGGAFITQRDMLNLRATAQVATILGVPATLVAVAPGVDAAAVASGYVERHACWSAATRVLAMSGAGALEPAEGPPPPKPENMEVLPDQLLEMPLADNGLRHVLTITCSFLRLVVFAPSVSHTALDTVRLLQERWCSYFGDPVFLCTDGGPHFNAKLLHALAESRGYSHNIALPRAPWTVAAERDNRNFRSKMVKATLTAKLLPKD